MDQGSNLVSPLMPEICRRNWIEKRSSSAYTLHGNGQTQRFNSKINDMLTQYVADNDKEWNLRIARVLFAYRSAVHASKAKTPFEVRSGRRSR